jgi:medium-chain acyl-[acyl-carrier-protein] hydrolase
MSKPPATAAWLTNPRPNPRAAVRLFCFPYAGCGASAFHRWPAGLPPTVEVRPVQLPGRESRFREEPFTRLTPLVGALADALRPHLDRPFVFFGHSLGALVSFELARELRRRGGPAPVGLLVAGRGAPHLPQRKPLLGHLPDEEFVEQLAAYGGVPAEVLAHQELLSLLLPALRADVLVSDTYTPTADTPLACPLHVYGGLEDADVPREDLQAWQELTTGPFDLHLFPGGHFFLHTAEALVLARVAQDLQLVARG